jgi:tetratricopeptide (TPR) repeat protein
MDYTEQLDIIYQFVDSDDYENALKHIENIRSQGCSDVVLILYEALCAYDVCDDIETLRLLNLFLKKSGHHEKKEYALFTIGICLMNLGLASEAKDIFSEISNSYPDIEEERNAARIKAESQKKGIALYNQIKMNKA